MGFNLFKGFNNHKSGEYFRCISHSREEFAFDWMVAPGGYVPFEHVHLCQEEVFYIKEGKIKFIIDGREVTGKKGDTVIVPKGKTHIAYNASENTLHCVVSYRPALDSYRIFQCMAGLTTDDHTDTRGQVSIPKMCFFITRMKSKALTRPSSIPPYLFTFALRLSFFAGKLFGWDRLYRKYTE